jgi:hypothetical protein
MTIKAPTHPEIAARAYQLFVERGRQNGHEMDDWLQAEYELMQLPVHKLAELEPTPAVATSKHAPRKQSIVEVVRAAMML